MRFDVGRSEKDRGHNDHVFLVLRDGGIDGGQLFVEVRYKQSSQAMQRAGHMSMSVTR